jgi:GDP-4-dehydro-6-deoxy-D-mannose reductase
MRVAVTGAAGFVGRHLCAWLAARGDAVLALRRPGAGGPCEVDVLDTMGLRRELEAFRPDAVVHLAGVSSVAASHEAPEEAVRVNALGALSVCVAVRHASPAARLLAVSSGEVYGIQQDMAQIGENAIPQPTSPYGAAKLASETIALQFWRSYGLDVIIARPFIHVGAGQASTFAIPSFARQLIDIAVSGTEGSVRVGNLDVWRDVCHVADVVDAYGLLLDRGAPGEVYNVCSGKGRSMRSLLEDMVACSGLNVRIVVDRRRFRLVETPVLVGDPSKIGALGWGPTRDVREALRDVLAEASDGRF